MLLKKNFYIYIINIVSFVKPMFHNFSFFFLLRYYVPFSFLCSFDSFAVAFLNDRLFVKHFRYLTHVADGKRLHGI